jgi:hypothetical protein
MSNAIFGADFVDPHGSGIGRVAAARLFTKLDAITLLE